MERILVLSLISGCFPTIRDRRLRFLRDIRGDSTLEAPAASTGPTDIAPLVGLDDISLWQVMMDVSRQYPIGRLLYGKFFEGPAAEFYVYGRDLDPELRTWLASAPPWKIGLLENALERAWSSRAGLGGGRSKIIVDLLPYPARNPVPSVLVKYDSRMTIGEASAYRSIGDHPTIRAIHEAELDAWRVCVFALTPLAPDDLRQLRNCISKDLTKVPVLKQGHEEILREVVRPLIRELMS